MLNLQLKDVAHKDDLYVESSSSLNALIERMNKNRKGVVVVLDNRRPLGILTERDIVGIVYNGADLNESVDRYTNKALVTTRGDRTIGYALNLAIANNIRRVIVIDDNGYFLGIVTLQDLLKYIEEDFCRMSIKTRHILKRSGNLISVAEDDTIQEAMGKIVNNKISAVLVIKDRRASGILTEKDILNLIGNGISLDSKVKKYMSGPVDTATLDSPLTEVVELMNDKQIRRVVVIDSEGIPIDVITIRDVIENLEGDYNRFLQRKLQSAKEILNMLPEMLIEVTDTGSEQLIIWANDKAISRFGGKIIDTPITNLLPDEQWDKLYTSLTKLNKVERFKIKKDDKIFELSGFFIQTFIGTEKGRFHILMRDITEDIRLSMIDPLTNIYNRRFVNGFLIKEVERSKRLNLKFSLVIADIDDFKNINDTYGHLAGDIILESVSQILNDTFRSQDVVGRYGGDEFMIILPDAKIEVASSTIERLRKKIESIDFTVVNHRKVRVTSSFGIATFPEDGTSLDDLLVKADERLYKAKSLGKNKVA